MMTPRLIERLIQAVQIKVKPKHAARDAFFEGMMAIHSPPITIKQHLAAKERDRQEENDLKAVRKWQEANPPLPGQIYVTWSLGTLSAYDRKHLHGYATTIKIGDRAWDKWGWPVGDPNSPATLYD